MKTLEEMQRQVDLLKADVAWAAQRVAWLERDLARVAGVPTREESMARHPCAPRQAS